MRTSLVICKFCQKQEVVANSRAKTYVYCSMACMRKGYRKIQFVAGQKIGKWEIVSDFVIRKYGRGYLTVKCSCGLSEQQLITSTNLQKITSSGCNKCSKRHNYTGYEGISGDFWSSMKRGALSRKVPFLITIEQAWKLFIKQDGKCALSGLPLSMEKVMKKSKNTRNVSSFRTASLDRIDSKKGYEPGNIQWIHKDINLMKNKFSIDYFLRTCKLISEYEDKNKEITS